MLTCEICILTGGLSRRMGRDKSKLPLGRSTMLGQIKATAKETGHPVRLISRDLRAGIGPLGGIYTALMTTRCESILFLACDMPFIEQDLLSRVLSETRLDLKAVFVSASSKFGFPFLLSQQTLYTVEEQIRSGAVSLQNLAKALKAKRLRIPAGMRAQLRNVNTPAEWENCRKLWDRRARSGPGWRK